MQDALTRSDAPDYQGRLILAEGLIEIAP